MTYSCGQGARSDGFSRSISKYSLGVSGLALMVGLIASTGAQAQCTPDADLAKWFPFGNGASINALSSVVGTVNTAFLTSTSAFVSAPGDAVPNQQGGGFWMRGIGGTVDTKADSYICGTFSYLGPESISNKSTTKVSQDFRGFQAGQDIATLNSGAFGANWHFGVTGGYAEAKFRDASGGSLSGDIQVPFGGVYAAFTRGNLFADVMARADFYQGALNDPVNAIANQRINARGYSLTGGIGYRFDLPNNFFLEPSVGGVLSHVEVDPIDVTGSYVVPSNPNLSDPGRVQLGSVDSELGRISARVGTSLTALDGKVVAQPFFAASVYREFAGNVTASVSNNAVTDRLTDFQDAANVRVSRIGTYAQLGVGSAFQVVNTGWLGYLRADWRTGDNIEGFSINGGLRYQLTRDADLESLKDTPVSFKDGLSHDRAHNWSGLYLGDTVGGLRGTEHWRWVGVSGGVDPDFAGYLLSSQVGYNWQMGRIVMGVEGDFGFANGRGGVSCSNPAFSCEANVDDLAFVTARLGYAWGRAMLYAKGGVAFGNVTAQSHWNAGTGDLWDYNNDSPYTLAKTASTSNWETGWTVGAGMEFALTDRWSAKAEYMHFDLGSERFTIAHPTQADVNVYGDVVRVGVNYHIGLDTASDSYK
jgi:opacity protein-like surface antigen